MEQNMVSSKFKEVYEIDVNQYTEKKRNLTYLSWANAWKEFKRVYPKAEYVVKKNPEGLPYFHSKIGYMVYTEVTAEDLTYEMWLPVMDGANKAMRHEQYSYKTKGGNKTCEPATMFDINKTVMRCLTKNLAMFGLGLYIYAGEDLPSHEPNLLTPGQVKVISELMSKSNVEPTWYYGSITEWLNYNIYKIEVIREENFKMVSDNLLSIIKNNEAKQNQGVNNA